MTLAEKAQQFSKGLPIEYWTWCSLLLMDGEEKMRRILQKCQPITNALEIGTFLGLGTALIAEYADNVLGFDIIDYGKEFRESFWRGVGVNKKIQYSVASNNVDKTRIIKSRNFDFVFVDGGHMYEEVEFDFSLVYECPKILLHDYGLEWEDVRRFVNKILAEGWNGIRYEAEIDVPFCLLKRLD